MSRLARLPAIMAVMATLLWAATVQATEVYIPHLTGGEADWVDYLQVDNLGLGAASYTVNLYAGGAKVATESGSVPGLSHKIVNLQDLDGDAECGIVTFSSNLMQFRLSYEHTTGQGVAEFRLGDELFSSLSFLFSDFNPRIDWKGLALANLGASQATATLYALGGGTVLAQASQTAGAKSRVHGTFARWFPNLSFDQVEKVVAVAGSPNLAGIVISGSNSADRLLFTTAADAAGFNSGQQPGGSVTGTWKGSWQSYGSGSGSLTLKLTQTGSIVTGTMSVTNTECGTMSNVPLTGVMSANELDVSATTSCEGSIVTLGFTQGVLDGASLDGVYEILVDGQGYDDGTWTTTKQ
jgi:hypothetical protein